MLYKIYKIFKLLILLHINKHLKLLIYRGICQQMETIYYILIVKVSAYKTRTCKNMSVARYYTNLINALY